MAHNNIYQVSLTPLTPEDYIDEEMFFDNFVGNKASYVEESKDRDKDIQALQKELKDAAEWDGNSFKIVDKKAFFRGKHLRFNDVLEKISLYELDDFSGNNPSDLDFDMYRLNKCYSDEFGTFFYDDQNNTRTIDQFVRQANIGETWYVGNVITYHF